MSDYTKLTNFAIKDALETGDPQKLILGEEIDDEYNAIATAITSKLNAVQADIGAAFYPQTAAELAGSVTPTRFEYPAGDIRRYCTAAETDHTVAFTRAHAGNSVIYAPAGTWNVDYFLMDTDGRMLKTDGFSTIIHQRTGNINRRVIEVCASNIIIGDLKITGNIATDTGEQQHGIFVSGNHPTGADRDIENVVIGNVWGEDIRGDVVYLGAPAGSVTKNIRFGVIRGTNTYRNVVSIVGASHVQGVGITTDGGCGYETFDIEPDGAATSTDIRIGFVRGGNIQCAPPVSVARRIYIGTADLDPAYQPNSTPGYSEGGSSYAVQIRTAVNIRNTVGFRIEYLRLRDHSHFGINYIFNPGEQVGENITIGYLDSSGVGASESTINALLNLASVRSFTLDDGDVTLESPTTDYVLVGNSSTRDNQFIVNRIKVNGTLCRFSTASRFSGVFADHTNNVVLLRECDNFVLTNSNITAPRLIFNCTGAVIMATAATCSTDYLAGTNSNFSFMNCSGGLASILRGSATYDPGSLADGDGVTTTVTATGASLGDFAEASFSLDLQGITLTAYVSAPDTVSVRFQNETTFVKDLSSGTIRVNVWKP